MKCHCNEVEELRVENDLLREKAQETWDCATSWEARWQEADHKRELAEAKLAKIEAVLGDIEADDVGGITAELIYDLRAILDGGPADGSTFGCWSDE